MITDTHRHFRRKHVWFSCRHCACRWPSTVRWKGIGGHSADMTQFGSILYWSGIWIAIFRGYYLTLGLVFLHCKYFSKKKKLANNKLQVTVVQNQHNEWVYTYYPDSTGRKKMCLFRLHISIQTSGLPVVFGFCLHWRVLSYMHLNYLRLCWSISWLLMDDLVTRRGRASATMVRANILPQTSWGT